MTKAIEVLRSEQIAAEIETAERKQVELKERISQITESVKELQDRLGRAMAGLGDSESVAELRTSLRDAQDERDACERGLQYLSDELERLAAKRKQAMVEERQVQAEAAVREAVEAIDELAALVDRWKAEAVPLVERAISTSTEAMRRERLAATAAGKSVPSVSAVRTRGWARQPGLEELVGVLRKLP